MARTPRDEVQERAAAEQRIVWVGAISAVLLLVTAVIVLASAVHFAMKFW